MNTVSRFKSTLVVLLALAFASAMCVALVVARVGYTGELTHIFLTWNLFLAWIPFICALAARGWYERESRFGALMIVPCAAVWLIFFPNALYLVTDLIHLQPSGETLVWYDLVLLQSFALTGLLLGLVSLYLMQDMVSRSFGPAAGWLFVFVALGLGGFGVYLGRFQHWNSWDILYNPANLLADVWARIRHPFQYRRTVALSGLFSLFTISAYLILFAFTRFQQSLQPHDMGRR